MTNEMITQLRSNTLHTEMSGERRCRERSERAVYVNLSRLTTEQEERVHAAIFKTAKGRT